MTTGLTPKTIPDKNNEESTTGRQITASCMIYTLAEPCKNSTTNTINRHDQHSYLLQDPKTNQDEDQRERRIKKRGMDSSNGTPTKTMSIAMAGRIKRKEREENIKKVDNEEWLVAVKAALDEMEEKRKNRMDRKHDAN